MRWASAISEHDALPHAVETAAAQISRALDGIAPSLVLAFVSPHHQAAYENLPREVARAFPGAILIGCTGGGVIGAGREIEGARAVSLIAAALPGVTISAFHLDTHELLPAGSTREEWSKLIGLPATAKDPQFIVLPDPFTFDAGAFLLGLDQIFPASKKIGGLASGGRAPGSNALFLGDRVFKSGAVGIALEGDLVVDTIVAQGCKPIGEPMMITRCEENVIYELQQRPPLEVLKEIYESLSTRDQELVQHSLFIGVEMKDQREYHAGDFLIRNIVGIDPQKGAIAVGALPRQWQVAQFHLRDAHTSEEDLSRRLDSYKTGGASPHGALLFSCLGRGEHLYGRPDHDSGLFLQRFEKTPIAGFFCNGEIGPVGGTTFLHGYTSSFGLFRAKQGS
jgi:small ligand-binding sensory domain FIST